MATKKGIPLRNGSGGGVGKNQGRGGCKPTERKGLKVNSSRSGGRNRR